MKNLGQPLRNICNALKRIANDFPDVQIVYPVHLNPAVREVANEILGNNPAFLLIDPVDVNELHNAMHRSYMIMTDSGGLQGGGAVPWQTRSCFKKRNGTPGGNRSRHG